MKVLQGREGNSGLMLRVAVEGGGCQGFEYRMTMESEAGAEDKVFSQNGVSVVVDSVSLPYLAGAEIDYQDDLIGAQFVINNPNADSSCGCGTSFSVK